MAANRSDSAKPPADLDLPVRKRPRHPSADRADKADPGDLKVRASLPRKPPKGQGGQSRDLGPPDENDLAAMQLIELPPARG